MRKQGERGEFPNLFEQPDEELPSDPMELPRPQVEDRSAGFVISKGRVWFYAHAGASEHVFMQQMWEDEEWHLFATESGASSSLDVLYRKHSWREVRVNGNVCVEEQLLFSV